MHRYDEANVADRGKSEGLSFSVVTQGIPNAVDLCRKDGDRSEPLLGSH